MSKKNRNENSKLSAVEAPSRMADYFWVNMIFFGFLTLLAGVVWQSCQDPTDDPSVKLIMAETFKFMILLFGGGFVCVTLFDAAYDFFAEKAEAPEQGQ